MNAGVLDVALALCGQFFSKVCGMLVFDVLDDWVPARSQSKSLSL